MRAPDNVLRLIAVFGLHRLTVAWINIVELP